MSKEFIFTMQDVRKVADGREILKGINLSFYFGAKIGIIGPNGAGKSSLLKILAGVDHDHMGIAKPHPRIKIGYVPQEPRLDENLSVQGNIELGFGAIKQALARFEAVSLRFADPLTDDEMQQLLEEQGELQDYIDAVDGWSLDRNIERIVQSLRLPAGSTQVSQLSGGERRRVALAQVLFEQTEMLLLDEPTNHLDAESVAWLEEQLKNYPGCIVAVTHDRYFLDNVAEWILELDRGSGVPYKGNYTEWLEQKEAQLAVEEKTMSSKRRHLQRELEWVRLSAKGRTAKQKARIHNYEALLQETSQQRSMLQGEIFIPPGGKLPRHAMVASHLKKSFGDRVLFADLNFTIEPGAIVGIVGANGAGKSTLFRILSGVEPIDAGELQIAPQVKLAYAGQMRDLDGEKSVFEEICEGLDYLDLGETRIPSRAYLGNFAFKGADQQKKVKNLSGGERNRAYLAKILRTGANVILLDEPSNDLDVETLRSLEEALLEFAGCALVISHDRWFLDRVATHILAFEGNGQTTFYPGNYADYEMDKKTRLAK